MFQKPTTKDTHTRHHPDVPHPTVTFTNTFLQKSTDVPVSSIKDVNYGYVILGFMFDFLYHISVVLIFSAVVSGIIIDAFAELRAKNNVILDENANTCFICDIDREDFEQIACLNESPDFIDFLAQKVKDWQAGAFESAKATPPAYVER